MTTEAKEFPLQEITINNVQGYAFVLALNEARLNGVLTAEQITTISERADEFITAMLTGQIIDTYKEKPAVIRPADPDEAAQLGADKVLEI